MDAKKAAKIVRNILIYVVVPGGFALAAYHTYGYVKKVYDQKKKAQQEGETKTEKTA